MGNGFKENSVNNTDTKKYKDNFSRIFSERVKIDCKKCDLSSRQLEGEDFICPHCGYKND